MFSSPNPEKPNHWFGRIASNPSFHGGIKVINFSQVCPECYRKNSSLISCEHIKIKKSRLKESNVSGLKELLGDSLQYELGGVTQSTSYAAFDSKKIELLFTNDFIIKYDDKNVKFFVCCIDPSYGGENETAGSFGYLDADGNYVLCWLYSYSPKLLNEFEDLILTNISKFRSVYSDSKLKSIYIVVENGSRWDASVLKEKIDELGEESIYYRNIHFIIDYYKTNKQDDRSKLVPGINATKDRLNNMVSFFARGLEQNKIHISDIFSTWNQDNITPQSQLNIVKDQLLEFRHFDENSNKKYQPNKKRPKNNSGKSFRKNDDSAIVFQMLIYWIEQLYFGVSYRSQIKENNHVFSFE